jgi:hypothetical protein
VKREPSISLSLSSKNGEILSSFLLDIFQKGDLSFLGAHQIFLGFRV